MNVKVADVLRAAASKRSPFDAVLLALIQAIDEIRDRFS